jgi:DNA-binding transcriptional MerR regulator
MKEKLYTAGEIAKLSGVSSRTIRFYDGKGLLKPVEYSPGGYRYYNEDSINVLQKILMLKYLGFSLEQIAKMVIDTDSFSKNGNGEGLKQSLRMQKKLLLDRKDHLERLIHAVDMAEQDDERNDLESLITIFHLLTEEEMTAKQYQNDSNLQKRINIHSFSTSKISWTTWVFDHIDLREGMKILEIGCGNALLWEQNIDRIPNNTTIYMTDYSTGMLEKAENVLGSYSEKLEERKVRFLFRKADANSFDIDETNFDRIIANHMLYHVTERQKLFRKVKELLNLEGYFFCSTIGEKHMYELNQLTEDFNSEIQLPLRSIAESFCLENGEDQLGKFFPHVERSDHDCDLIVDNIESIYDYVYSFPGNAASILDNSKDEFLEYIGKQMDKEGAIFIRKSAGIFKCWL